MLLLLHAGVLTSKNLRFKDGPRKEGLILLILETPSVMVGSLLQLSTSSIFLLSLATSSASNHSYESGPTCLEILAILLVLAFAKVCFLVFNFMLDKCWLLVLSRWIGHLCQNRSQPHFHFATLVLVWQPLHLISLSRSLCWKGSHELDSTWGQFFTAPMREYTALSVP